MSKITLNNVASLQNEATALSVINGNSAIIQAAMDNTLSRDGTQPDQMNYLLDMNSNPIINLPAPTSSYMPLRLIDAQTLNGGGTIVTSPLPVGGTTGQVLAKNSNTNYDVGWTSASGGAGNPGGALNSIQYNSAGGFGGLSLTAGQTLRGTSGAPVAALPAWVDVTTMGVDNTGATVTAAALQAAINTITAANSVVYLPAGNYNMGGLSISIPSNATVYCHRNATLTRTADIPNVGTEAYGAYTDAMIYIGNSNNVRWYNGTFVNTVVTGTSTTSQVLSGTSLTFTTQAGLPYVVGSFLRAYSASNPSFHGEGSVTSYTGTSLTINFSFYTGTGSKADWNFNWAAVYQSPMCLHNANNCIIDGVTTTGNWYVGFMMDGWNPNTGGSNSCNNNTIINCQALGIQNRGFYQYGICNENTFMNCYVNGSINGYVYCTDYGFNNNPANAIGTFNSQAKNRFIGCSVYGTYGQGIGFGDNCYYCSVEACNAYQINSTGFLWTNANGTPTGNNSPQYNSCTGCIANNCGYGFYTVGSVYTQITGCKAVACGNGFTTSTSAGIQAQYTSFNSCHAAGNTVAGFSILGIRHDLIGITAIANGTGVLINGGSVATIVSGRSYANTTNYLDSGTSSQISLITI